jgi:diaminohydroxyphosphoribosylaminopyrimidine deaminase/5-amino-6-(5-phosphoribosylamino)uracil reductase
VTQLLVPHSVALDESCVWALLRELAQRACAGRALAERTGFAIDGSGRLVESSLERSSLVLDPSSERPFFGSSRLSPAVSELLELYLPLCIGRASSNLVIAHVGQSLDGQIATASGASRYVTGPENIRHMHRLRALCDAVIVGAGTVEADDPQLTTRLVVGDNPVRVVIDPALRVARERLIFRDHSARTLVVCDKQRAAAGHAAELIPLAQQNGVLPVARLIDELRARGLRRLFIEGGGVTVSHFLGARALSRLHVTICPVIIGQGKPGIALPGVERMEQALRPKARRFSLGDDVLFDCEL